MKLHLASFLLLMLSLTLAAAPAGAVDIQLLYSNGPLDGYTNAWTINYGYSVYDSFTLSTSGTMTSFSFGVWVYPGDRPLTVDYQIWTNPQSGTLLAAGTSNLIDAFQFNNGWPNGGYDVYISTAFTAPISLLGGNTYWLRLLDATTVQGNPMFWDENSGIGCSSPGCPSQAYDEYGGIFTSIASEDPDFFGYTTAGSTPEPGSILLFGSGVLVLAGVVRRKLGL